jgi:hypothetical protein
VYLRDFLISIYLCNIRAYNFSFYKIDLRNMDLEKERDDEASPRGVLEACVRGFDAQQSPEPETSCSNSRARSHWGRFFKLWKRKSVKRLASIPPIGVPRMPKWKSKSTRENCDMSSNLQNFRSSLVTFSLSDLRNATDNFNQGM